MSPLYLFIFTKVASTTGFVVVCFAAALLLTLARKKRSAWVFLSSALGLMASSEMLKNLFHIPRPVDALILASGYAFPSGHAAGAIFLALIFSYFARTLRVPFRYSIWFAYGIGALTIGLSRLQLGVHTPTQVLAGYALGAVWAFVCIIALKHPSRKDKDG